MLLGMTVPFRILFILVVVNSASISNEGELILVHVIFRHGARTPNAFYPTDPNANHSFYPIGRAGLTNQGKMMMFNVGERLRQEYGKLLGDDYTEEKIFTRSSDRARTKMSALLVLAGLWPPSKQQKWHPTLEWIPIPIFTKPKDQEDLLNPVNCQARKKLIIHQQRNMTLYNKYIKPHQPLLDIIEKKSGTKVESLFDILELFFTLQTETEYGLKLPDWTRDVYPEPLKSILPQVYEFINADRTLESIQSGYLIKKIIEDSKYKISSAASLKDRVMFLYSAHDTNIGGLLHALKIPIREIPHYGSSVIFELRKMYNNYYFKVRYLRTPLKPDIEDLILPNCEKLCPLDTFTQLHAGILPTGSYSEVCSR